MTFSDFAAGCLMWFLGAVLLLETVLALTLALIATWERIG